jgi:hypothetical protein
MQARIVHETAPPTLKGQEPMISISIELREEGWSHTEAVTLTESQRRDAGKLDATVQRLLTKKGKPAIFEWAETYRIRRKGTRQFWAHRGRWQHEDDGFLTDFDEYQSLGEAQRVLSVIAETAEIGKDELIIVSRNGDEHPANTN